MTWALACFEPFANARTNSSQIVLDHLSARVSDQFVVLKPLPVVFATAWPTLRAELKRRPDVTGVLCFGQAAGRARVDLEQVALNFVDAGGPDNAGAKPKRGPVSPGPDVRWGTIPWPDEVFPGCARSYSAGTFVCNALFYESLAWAAEDPSRRAGFVHVPALRSQLEFSAIHQVADGDVFAAVDHVLNFLSAL